MQSKKSVRGTRKLYTEYEYVHVYQNNAYMISQYDRTNIFLIWTSKCHTMNGMLHRGRWFLANKSTNIQRQKSQVNLNSLSLWKSHTQMTQRQRNKKEKTRLNAQIILHRRHWTFQILPQTYEIIQRYIDPHPLKVHLFPTIPAYICCI